MEPVFHYIDCADLFVFLKSIVVVATQDKNGRLTNGAANIENRFKVLKKEATMTPLFGRATLLFH